MADKTVTYRLLADITQFRAQMAQAAASVQTAAGRMTAATKEGVAFRNTLSTVGRVGGAAGLIAAGGLAVAVKAAADFDQGMSKVQAATHESAANMELLRAAALKAGADTKFSATEAASGVEALAKAGVSTRDILGGGLTGALSLAAAGSISVGDAAETAATAMTQFGLSGQEVPHIADLLAAAAGKAQGEVGDMGMALKQSGLVAAQMGISIEEATGTLAAFASAGLLGSDAGTSFRTMLLRLANPSKQAASTMKELGINAYDAQGNLVSMADLAGQLQVAFKGQSQETRNAALATIFGSDAIRAANVLYSQGAKGIGDWTSKVNDAGYAAKTAAINMDNLKGDLEQFKGSLETALIGTGEGTQGPLRSLVQSLTDVVNGYNKLPPAAQSATGAFLGITAAAGGGLYVFSKVVNGIADTRAALSDLGPAGTKAAAGLRLLGTATAVVGGVLILHEAIQSLEKSMQDALPTAQELAGRLLDLSNADVGNIGKQFDDLGGSIDYFQKNTNTASNVIGKLTEWAPDIQGFVGSLVGFKSGGENIQILTDQFAALDSALASITSSGSAAQARQAFASLAAAQGLTGEQQKFLLTQLPQYRDALAGAANQTKLTGDAAGSAAGGVSQMGGALGTATRAAQTFKGALAELNGLLDKRDAIRNYQASLDDFRKNFKKSAGFNLDIDPGRQNQQKLDAIAESAGVVASHLKGIARTEFVNSAIGQLRALGHQLGVPPGQIKLIIAALQNLGHQHPTPHVEVTGVVGGIAQINSLRNQLALLHDKQITVTVTTNHRGGVTSSYGGRTAPSADGNLFEFASGGFLPRIGDQQPQVRAYSGPRGLTWSEAGSGPWEAFISGHPAKVDRSRAIAADVVSRLGGQVQFADGGMTGRTSIPAPVVNVSGASRDELKMFADMVGDRVAKAVRSNGQSSYAQSRLGVGP